jgi:hypothetical protein
VIQTIFLLQHHPKNIKTMMQRLLFFSCLLLTNFCFAQYLNNKWLMGIHGNYPYPYGGTMVEFSNNMRTVTYQPINTYHNECFSGLSEKNSDWFLYTNGWVICNKDHDTLVNGGDLSPNSTGATSFLGFPFISQSVFVPGDTVNEKHYLFHSNWEGAAVVPVFGAVPFANKLFFSRIDPLAANGMGAVFSKNNVILEDTLEIGNVLAVRHGNGRDWWVVVKRFTKDLYYSFLVTPDSVYAPNVLNTDPTPAHVIGGQASISPNGKFYASFSNGSQLRLFDFDRCNGGLSNYRYKFITNTLAGAVSFSPNSQFLYISTYDSLWQFDMEATDVLASQTFIARYDGFVDTTLNTGTGFWYHWLGPDGKIYITTSNQSRKLHVINQPDMPGQACDFQQHSVDLPRLNNFTTPSYINLSLYHDPDSPCDTLGVGIPKLSIRNNELRIFPNPSDGRFSVEYTPQRVSGKLYIYDLSGKEVYSEYVSPFTSIKNIDLSKKLEQGVYAVCLVFGKSRSMVKMMVGPE